MEVSGKEYYDLGFNYLENNEYEKALEYFNKAIELNESAGYNGLAVCYEEGKGVEQNIQLANKYYLLSAEKGYPSAMRNIAVQYLNGNGVEKDPTVSVYWWKKAANEHNDAIAMFNLGYACAKGIGTNQDYNQAFYWYEKAGHLDNKDALNNLGFMYYNAVGVQEDDEP